MTRLTRFVLVFALAIGSSLELPAQSEAGVIPWAYDAIFGPVGSLRGQTAYAGYGTSYAPYSAGYGSYGMGYGTSSSSYAPVSVAYLPPTSAGSCGCGPTSAYYGSSANYGYSSYGYAPAYSASNGCNSCASGNCSTGTSVITNSAPNGGSSIAPIPDSQTLRNELSRLRYLEEKVYELEHQQIQDEKLMKEQFPNFRRDPYVPRTRTRYDDQGGIVPARQNMKKSTFSSGSDPDAVDTANDPDFAKPHPSAGHRRNRAGEVEVDTQKVPLTPPVDEKKDSETGKPAADKSKETDNTKATEVGADADKSKVPNPGSESNKSANEVKEKEPITMKLENMVTTRPVVSHGRFSSDISRVPANIAKSQRKPIKTLDTSREADFVRR